MSPGSNVTLGGFDKWEKGVEVDRGESGSYVAKGRVCGGESGVDVRLNSEFRLVGDEEEEGVYVPLFTHFSPTKGASTGGRRTKCFFPRTCT